MYKIVLLLCAFTTISLFGSPQAIASNEVCLDFKSILIGEQFTAKVPLYDTKIEVDGIAKLERDKEEVPQGAMLRVLKVECEGDNLEVKIREISEKKRDSVTIHFRFPMKFRRLGDPVGDLRKMMDLVFESSR